MRYRKQIWGYFGGGIPVHAHGRGRGRALPLPWEATARDSDPAQISSMSTPHSPRTHRSLVIKTHDTHLWEKRTTQARDHRTEKAFETPPPPKDGTTGGGGDVCYIMYVCMYVCINI